MKRFILAALLLCPSIVFPQGAALSPVPKIQFLDNNGKPLANGYLYTYSAGTSSLLPTYTDASGTTQNTDPVRLDSGGFANIWLGNDSYRMVLQDSKGATIWTVDNVQNTGQIQIACAGTPNCFVKLDANGFVPQENLNYIQGATGSANRTVQNRLQDTISVKDFGATGNGTTDDTAAIQAALNAVCAGGGQPGKGGDLFFPPGTYKITATIGPPSACEGVDIHGPSDSELTGIGVHISWAGAANGTVWSNYGLCWSKIHDLHIDGNGTAGIGFLTYADTVSPVVRSSQRNHFWHIYVKGVQGTPGNCVQVGRTGHGDDVSQSAYYLFNIDFCNVGVMQDGGQTVENLYSFNTFGSSIATYSMQFLGGDIHLFDNTFIGGGPSSKIANIYVGPISLRADLNRNYYEDLSPLDPTVFSNYLFAQGSNPNRPFPTKIDSDRVEWKLLGGKPLNYQQAGPITIINHTADDIQQPQDPGQYYITSGTGCCTVFAEFLGGWFSSPSQTISIGNNVIAHIDNSSNQMMSNVFEGRDASITSGSATLTIGATNSFTSSMVGYVCYVQNYLTGNIAQQNAITAFTDATHVTLANAATNSGSSLFYRCGRLVNAGQANTVMATVGALNEASSVVEGQTPQYQLRRFLFGSAWQSWAWRVDSGGAHLSIMNGDNPLNATYSPFISMIQSAGAPSSITLEVPARIGSSTYQKMGVFFQDFAGVNPGTIAANSSFTTSLALTVDTVTPGADWCQVFQGTYTAGIISTCIIQTGNTAQMSLYNVTSGSITPGTNTYRVIVNKFSYTGP